MTKRKYDTDAQAAKNLAEALQELPSNFVVCRDMRHAWSVEEDFHVVEEPPRKGRARKGHVIERDLVCMRCDTFRIETYGRGKYGLVKESTRMRYPDGYLLQGKKIPRGVKPSEIVQAEQYRRAMGRAAASARDVA